MTLIPYHLSPQCQNASEFDPPFRKAKLPSVGQTPAFDCAFTTTENVAVSNRKKNELCVNIVQIDCSWLSLFQLLMLLLTLFVAFIDVTRCLFPMTT